MFHGRFSRSIAALKLIENGQKQSWRGGGCVGDATQSLREHLFNQATMVRLERPLTLKSNQEETLNFRAKKIYSRYNQVLLLFGIGMVRLHFLTLLIV